MTIFEISHFFGKHFLTSPYEYSNESSWWCHRLTIIVDIYYTWNFELLVVRGFFSRIAGNNRDYPCINTYIRINIICSFILGRDPNRKVYILNKLKYEIFVIFVNEMCRKLWGDDIINSLIWIFIRTGQEILFSGKECEISKCHNVLHFLVRFSSFLQQSVGKFLTLSFEIMVILDWTSPLTFSFILLYRYIDMDIVSWEPEGRYCRSTMFRWEPEWRYCHWLCTVIAPFWFSTKHLWAAITPFWLSTDDIRY